MPLSKQKINKILYKQNTEILTHVLSAISQDYDIEFEELNKKYIKPLVNYTRPKNKGKQTSYSIFLKDEEIRKHIDEKHGEITFTERSKIYSELWKVMSKKDKDEYKKRAIEINKNL